MPEPIPQVVTLNPYAKELGYFKAALEVGVGIWLMRKAISGERLPKTYIWWGAVGAFGAGAYAFYRSQKLERPEDRVIPVQQIETWVPQEVMAAL